MLSVLADVPECSVFTGLVAMQDQAKQELMKMLKFWKILLAPWRLVFFQCCSSCLRVKSIDFLLIFLLKKTTKTKQNTRNAKSDNTHHHHHTEFKSLLTYPLMYLCLHTWEIDRWFGGVAWRQNLSIVMKSELSLKTTLLIYWSVYHTILSFGSWLKELGCNCNYWPLKSASFAGWPRCPLAKGWEAWSSRKTSE